MLSVSKMHKNFKFIPFKYEAAAVATKRKEEFMIKFFSDLSMGSKENLCFFNNEFHENTLKNKCSSA